LGSRIVGRDEERAVLASFLGQVPTGPSALLLEGEAGIGKSILWLDGVNLARARGLRVLTSRPAEAERTLVHVGLGDLLEDVLEDALPALAAPRRRALGVAMLRDDASGTPVDHRAVALAVRDVLQHLGKNEPVVVAVDDVQWLDASSSAALVFALRRLPASHVLMLLARRPVDESHPPTLEEALPRPEVRRVPVGPLSVDRKSTV
jgi:predicted ATPase